MENFLSFFPVFVVIAIALVVILTELIKKIDKKDRLKGYRVYIPAFLSLGTVFLLKIGNFFVSGQIWFWWAVIFGFSVFFFEAILKKITTAIQGHG